MVSSGISGYDSYSSSAGRSVEVDADGNDGDATWPEGLFDTADSGQQHGVGVDPNFTHNSDFLNNVSRPTPEEDTTMGEGGRSVGEDVICFKLDPSTLGDSALKFFYDDGDERMVATLGRDLDVVTTTHLRNMAKAGQNLRHVARTIPFKPIRHRQNCTSGLSAVVSNLTSLMTSIVGTFGREEEKFGESSSTRMQQTGYDTLPVKLLPNHEGIFFTRLISRSTGVRKCFPTPFEEVSDYCISNQNILKQSHALYRDVAGLVLSRKEMMTLEIGVTVAPQIINAWARVLTDKWRSAKIMDRTCLPVMEQDKLQLQHDIVNSWVTWLTCFENYPTEHKHALIFIPIFISNHFNLLVVNFPLRKIVCYVSHAKTNNTNWEAFAAFFVACFRTFLSRLQDSRCTDVGEFNFEILEPIWSESILTPDSGVAVMHMMETYELSGESSAIMCMTQEHLRDRIRICCCASIVGSRLNLEKQVVLEATGEFVRQKCDHTISPSQDIKEFRALFDKIPIL